MFQIPLNVNLDKGLINPKVLGYISDLLFLIVLLSVGCLLLSTEQAQISWEAASN